MSAQLQSEIQERLKTAGRVSLFAGFDGTLVAIQDDPSEPRLDPNTAELFKLFASLDFFVPTVISGRAIEDLYSRVGLTNVIYVGNHGMEIFGRDLRFVHPGASALRGKMEMLNDEVEKELRRFPGAKIEFKGLSTSVHFRMASDEEAARIIRIVGAALERVAGQSFRLIPDDKVLEIIPSVSWNKGSAARWINSQLPAQPEGADVLSVYLGDDAGDEEAFRLLPDAVTVHVGPSSETCAQYRLPDQAAVGGFLQWLSVQEAAGPRRA
jgi:trehalose 6-phosphate phosphatase